MKHARNDPGRDLAGEPGFCSASNDLGGSIMTKGRVLSTDAGSVGRIGILVIAAVLALLAQACGGSEEDALEVGSRAPSFTLPAASGGEVSLSAYQGTEPVLLYFHMADG